VKEPGGPSERPAWVLAAWLGTALLLVLWPVKFGNPENPNFAPLPDVGGLWMFALGPWPIEWGYLATLVLGLALLAARWPAPQARWRLCWPELALAGWSAWIWTAGWLTSVYAYATWRFGLLTGVGLAAWGLGRAWAGDRQRWPVLLGALYLAVTLTTISAVQQRLWGFEDLRRYVAEHGGIEALPPLMQWKLMSNRASGPLINPNMFAGFLLAAAPPSAWWMAGALRRKWPRCPAAAAPALALAPGLVGLALSQSKAGILSLFAGVCGATWLALPRRWRRWFLPVAGAAAALGLAFALTLGRELLERGQVTGQARMDYWSVALRVGVERPVWGSGPATFGLMHPTHKAAGTEETQTVHNLPLQAFADSGVPGLLLAGALWVSALATAGAVARASTNWPEPRLQGLLWLGAAGCGAWWLHNLGDFHWFVPGDAHVALWLAGFLAGLAGRGGRIEVPGRPAAAVAAAGMTALLLFAGCEARAEARAREGVRQLAADHPYAAAAALSSAAAWSPGNAEIHRLRGRALASQGASAEALAAYERALALCPLRSGLHVEIGQLLWSQGERLGRTRQEAIAHLRRAVALYPTKASYHRRLAERLREVGQEEEAALHSRRAEELEAVPDPLAMPELPADAARSER